MRELLHGHFDQFVIKYNLLGYYISRPTNSAGFVQFCLGVPSLPLPPLSLPFPSLPFPLPPPSPSLPLPLSLPLSPLSPTLLLPSPLPLPPFPSLPLPPPLSSPPLPSLRSRPPFRGYGGVGERLSSPTGSGRSPAAKRFLVHFSRKI